MKTSDTFEERLRRLIIAVKMKDYEFANWWGVHRVSLSNYLIGKSKPDYEKIKMLGEKGIDINWLLTGKPFEINIKNTPHAKKQLWNSTVNLRNKILGELNEKK